MRRGKERTSGTQLDFSYLTSTEAAELIDKAVQEAGHPSADFLPTKSDEERPTIFKNPPSPGRSKQKLETKIKKNKGDLAWPLHEMMKTED